MCFLSSLRGSCLRRHRGQAWFFLFFCTLRFVTPSALLFPGQDFLWDPEGHWEKERREASFLLLKEEEREGYCAIGPLENRVSGRSWPS